MAPSKMKMLSKNLRNGLIAKKQTTLETDRQKNREKNITQ